MNKNSDTRYDVDFSEYHFNDHPGVFTYKLHKKLKTKNGNMSIFVQSVNGEKHQITLFPDSHFLGMKNVKVGSTIRVEFVVSKNGKVYAKSIEVKE